MRLKTLILRNFRCYKEETRMNFDDLTVFIGKNDIGKSSILDALEIFFNNEIVKIECLDASISGDNTDVCIGCIFSELPDQLVIDALSTTNLKDEYLLNKDGDLEIIKIYNCSLKKITTKIFARAIHPNNKNYDDLLELTNPKLKERIDELEINQMNIDLRSNVQMRKAIWSNYADLKTELRFISLEVEDGKKIWSKLQEYLPVYALFKSDRPSKDEDSEVQDPMKIAVAEAIKTVESKLNEIKKAVQNKAQEAAQRTLDKLKDMNPDLAQELSPRFKSEPKWESLFKLSLTSDHQVPLNKRGSGTRRLILLNFFRAEAERRQKDRKAPAIIYSIEEPETSQHPINQRILVDALSELSQKENCQVILTTHVPSLAGLIPVDCLRYVTKDKDGKIVTISKDESILEEIANQLGVLPDKRVQILICVEGPNDINFLKNICKIICAHDSSIPDISIDKRIAILPLGGSTLKQWVDNHYSKNIGLPEVHIYDRDDFNSPKYQSACEQVNKRNDNSWATLTNKKEFENYIHPDAIYEVFAVKLSFSDTDDVPKLIIDAVNKDPNNPFYPIGEKRAKRILNEQVIARMNYKRFCEMDSRREIENWFKEIAKRLRE